MKKIIISITYGVVTSLVIFCCILFIKNKIQNINLKQQKAQVVKIENQNEIKKIEPEKNYTKEELREQKELKYPICQKQMKDYDDMSELAIGQDTGLPDKKYIPENLRELNSDSSTRVGLCLTKEARDQFESLVAKAKEAGNNIKASSAFRSYNYQKILLADAIKNGNKDANTLIAKPGYSEHQLGTAVDVTSKSIDYVGSSSKLVAKFIETPEAKWMKESASIFGFIESYPLGKESITGYMYEPWHYRYVGVENAKEIIKTGKTINQFFEEKNLKAVPKI